MPARTLTAQSYVMEGTKIEVDRNGDITSYVVTANIRFGDSQHQREDFDLWPVMNATQKSKAQDIQNLAKTHLDTQITG